MVHTAVPGDVTEDTPLLPHYPPQKGGDQSSPSCHKVLPLLMVAGAGFIFSVHAVLSKLMPIPPGQYVSTESVFNLSFCLMVCSYLGVDVTPPWTMIHNAPWFWGRVLLGGLTSTVKILVVRNMNIGDATAILFSSPIWASLLARIILKEKFTIVNLAGIIMGFVGIILIAKPAVLFGDHRAEQGDTSVLWAGITLVVSLLIALSFVCIRGTRGAVHPLKFVLYTALVELTLGFVMNLAVGQPLVLPPCDWVKPTLFLCACTATIANMLIVKGMSLENSGPATMMRNWDTVYAYIFQITFFSHTPDWMCLTGAAMIVGTTVLQGVDRMKDISCGIEF